MKNFFLDITRNCSRLFFGLALISDFSQNIFGGKKEQQQFINFVLESPLAQENKLVKKVFSQPLESMGIEESPLKFEIKKWSKRKEDWCEDSDLLEALTVKSIVGLLGDRKENIEEKKPI